MDKKIVVLFIDDELDYGALIKAHLPAIGNFEVVCAHNGKEGLKLAGNIKPDIILLDIVMPDLDGFEVLEKLKKDNKTMAIPVIMLSGLDDDNVRIKASGLYDEGYITKPADSYQIKAKIEETLKIRGARPA
ncbi:MAG: response regulator [Candidatus Omnitrophica bacterium]|nr:response regulator [Candidatus Omnitrophota bacterium]